MERITDINQLKTGDKIIRFKGSGIYEILEFVCIHPKNDKFSVMLDTNLDGAPKFNNQALKDAGYYRYTGTMTQWAEIHKILAESLRKVCELHESKSKRILEQEALCKAEKTQEEAKHFEKKKPMI